MTIQEFIITLFEFQVNTHLIHFDPDAFSKHIALNELYSGLDGFTDRLAESYTGKYGIIQDYPKVMTVRTFLTPSELILFYVNKIESAREDFEDGWIQQIIDEMLELIYTTKYKIDRLP